ncbi:MAG: N-6 DNA methylase, partial [Holophagales bacterium]|nr:N-6 DNA methylase [Holophagales bacterium]
MSLFNAHLLEKHLEHIQFDPRHMEILAKWAENLEKGVYDVETQSDGEFIQHILIDVLGYVSSSEGQRWTLAKNQPVGHGNVDVALGSFTPDSASIIAPFELKGARTHNLDAVIPGRNKNPVQQAWEYAMDAKGARWVLVSNFRTIRLYAVGYGRKEYENFDLTREASPGEHARLMLLLSAKNLLGGHTLALLEESERTEKGITDELYRDYKGLRSRLIKTMDQDSTLDRAEAIRCAQTILDRVLFIAFAEDRDLLPQNTLNKPFNAAKHAISPVPIWENFKDLFRAIDEGSVRLDIPCFNGGLFASDAALDSLAISDELCLGFARIGTYDFESEHSVNILGHILEQSIADIDEMKNLDVGANRSAGRRKKEGVFYTPPHLTHYIVEQALGGWLEAKRKEIGFGDLPELPADVNMKAKKGKGLDAAIVAHVKAWEAYREALSNVKVLDPACGSGAFLVEVFDYLVREGKTVNNELTRLRGYPSLFRWETHILANNIFGVDLNHEAVEITKLSLWLKTANKDEKLSYLDDNIKVGNSLIDDSTVAGALAFD